MIFVIQEKQDMYGHLRYNLSPPEYPQIVVSTQIQILRLEGESN